MHPYWPQGTLKFLETRTTRVFFGFCLTINKIGDRWFLSPTIPVWGGGDVMLRRWVHGSRRFEATSIVQAPRALNGPWTLRNVANHLATRRPEFSRIPPWEPQNSRVLTTYFFLLHFYYSVAQGWSTFLRARAKTFYKFRSSSFAYHWELWRTK